MSDSTWKLERFPAPGVSESQLRTPDKVTHDGFLLAGAGLGVLLGALVSVLVFAPFSFTAVDGILAACVILASGLVGIGVAKLLVRLLSTRHDKKASAVAQLLTGSLIDAGWQAETEDVKQALRASPTILPGKFSHDGKMYSLDKVSFLDGEAQLRFKLEDLSQERVAKDVRTQNQGVTALQSWLQTVDADSVSIEEAFLAGVSWREV